MKKSIFIINLLCLFVLLPVKSKSQQFLKNAGFNETAIYAQTKQLIQFIKRFNSEEDVKGKTIFKTDSLYHNPQMRKLFIKNLFDNQNALISDSLKKKFIEFVTQSDKPQFLSFYKNKWFAEVSAKFYYKGIVQNAVLFLKIENENEGYKWVFTNIWFEPFNKLFLSDSTAKKKFIQPLSHELDFMNLNKVFADVNNIQVYTYHNFKPDILSVFLYEIKCGNIKLHSINHVKFTFFQIKNWGFEVSFINRNGYNTGWLITNLIEIDENIKHNYIQSIYQP